MTRDSKVTLVREYLKHGIEPEQLPALVCVRRGQKGDESLWTHLVKGFQVDDRQIPVPTVGSWDVTAMADHRGGSRRTLLQHRAGG